VVVLARLVSSSIPRAWSCSWMAARQSTRRLQLWTGSFAGTARAIRARLDNPDFIEALPGFLLPDAGSQARRHLLEARLRELSG
jgi:hypothetical protein